MTDDNQKPAVKQQYEQEQEQQQPQQQPLGLVVEQHESGERIKKSCEKQKVELTTSTTHTTNNNYNNKEEETITTTTTKSTKTKAEKKMYIADEILQFLVCEKCFETYNQKSRVPNALFPCGHTFCEECVRKFRNRECAACSTQVEAQAVNWSLVNLIPRGRIVDNYDEMVDELRQGMSTLERLQKLNAERVEINKDVFDAIRARIHERAAQLIEKITEGREILLQSVKQIEEKWTNEMRVESEYERAYVSIMNEFNARVDSEEIKTNEAKFARFREMLKTSVSEMSARVEEKSAEEYVNFKVSEVDLESAFDIENLFGELYVNDSGLEPSETPAFSEDMAADKQSKAIQSLNELTESTNESREQASVDKVFFFIYSCTLLFKSFVFFFKSHLFNVIFCCSC